MLKKYGLPILVGFGGYSTFVSAEILTTDILLKNLYADRKYDAQQADVGSWSQGMIARTQGQYELTDKVALQVTGSLQYAQRLSEDQHINDVILPFDQTIGEQAEHYKKVAGSVALKYENQKIHWGELWIDTPLATTDYARQLVTLYKGITYQIEGLNQNLEIGQINRFSPRNEEDFRKLSVKGIESDALNYVNYKYKFADQYFLNAYYGNLEDLYQQIHLGIDIKQPYRQLKLHSKIRFYDNQETGQEKLGDIDSQYYGILQNVSWKNHTVGLGYQKIAGNDAFPMIDTVPVLGYINWTQAMFSRAKEKSLHVNYQYQFDSVIPNLVLDLKYIRGDGFQVAERSHAKEQQLDVILSYKVKQGLFKGFGLQWFNINYKNNFGGDYTENRVFTTYAYQF